MICTKPEVVDALLTGGQDDRNRTSDRKEKCDNGIDEVDTDKCVKQMTYIEFDRRRRLKRHGYVMWQKHMRGMSFYRADFWLVDAVQLNPLAVNFDGIAIDDGGDGCNAFALCCPALCHTPNVERVPTLVVTNWFDMRRRMVPIKSAPEQCIGMTTSGLSASSSVTVCSI